MVKLRKVAVQHHLVTSYRVDLADHQVAADRLHCHDPWSSNTISHCRSSQRCAPTFSQNVPRCCGTRRSLRPPDGGRGDLLGEVMRMLRLFSAQATGQQNSSRLAGSGGSALRIGIRLFSMSKWYKFKWTAGAIRSLFSMPCSHQRKSPGPGRGFWCGVVLWRYQRVIAMRSTGVFRSSSMRRK